MIKLKKLTLGWSFMCRRKRNSSF